MPMYGSSGPLKLLGGGGALAATGIRSLTIAGFALGAIVLGFFLVRLAAARTRGE